MEFDQSKRLIEVALGNEPGDLAVCDCNLVDVYGETYFRCDIVIAEGRVAALVEPGEGEGRTIIDAGGNFAVPGLIDSHIHTESTLVSPNELARLIVPRGVTSIFADPHEVANVLGIEGIRLLLDLASLLPLRMWIQIPSRVPTAPGIETTGAVVGLQEIEEMLKWPEVIALGELDPTKVLPPRPEYLARVDLARRAGKITCGHAADLHGRELMAYATMGLLDEHESVTAKEVMERVGAGMRVFLREGTSERDLENLVKAVTELGAPSRRMMHCADDKQVLDILLEGHIDHNVRQGIEYGLTPMQSIQMATINPAEHFHVEHLIGGLGPGRFADLFLCSNLTELEADTVIFEGRVVAQQGELIDTPTAPEYPDWALDTIHLKQPLSATNFKITPPTGVDRVNAKIIKVLDELAIDEMILEEMVTTKGEVLSSLEREILKIAVIDRHEASGRIGLGFVTGFGPMRGAIASTVCHDNHNLIVVGSEDLEMAACANAVAEMGGGFALVHEGSVVARLPLRFAGIMSDAPYEIVNRDLAALRQAGSEIGCVLSTPFMKLSILALPTVPEIGLTDMGLVDVKSHSIIPLFS